MSLAPSPRPRIDWGQLPLVVAGGAMGVLARFLLALAWPGDGVVAVLLINVAGSALLGLLIGAAGDARRLRAFLGTGALGGFTSYSALVPWLTGAPGVAVAAAGLAGTVILGALAAGAGLAGGSAIARRRATS